MSDGHGGAAVAERPSYLGDHYDTPQQQFSSGKLGMWLFLSTEILLFAGLFCAYAVLRRNHPDVFLYAHHLLDTRMGAINTIVLIFSSFTMAWAVRAAQMGQRKLLVTLLSITVLCGATFMVVKYVEYTHKIHGGYMWGTKYQPAAHGEDAHGTEHGGSASAAAPAGAHDELVVIDQETGEPMAELPLITSVEEAKAAAAEADLAAGDPGARVRSEVPRAAVGPTGFSPGGTARAEVGEPPPNVHLFFGIYFLMTGLHGLHVLLGMGFIVWLIFRSAMGAYGPEYFTPVDLGGLYWHLVDLIWIFLFPLLYLIH